MQLAFIDISAVNHCTVIFSFTFLAYFSVFWVYFSPSRPDIPKMLFGFQSEGQAVFQAFLWHLLMNWRGSCWVMRELLFSLHFVLCADSTATGSFFFPFFFFCCTMHFFLLLATDSYYNRDVVVCLFVFFNHLSFIWCLVAVFHNKK